MCQNRLAEEIEFLGGFRGKAFDFEEERHRRWRLVKKRDNCFWTALLVPPEASGKFLFLTKISTLATFFSCFLETDYMPAMMIE